MKWHALLLFFVGPDLSKIAINSQTICEDGYTAWANGNGCFRLFTTPALYADARAACQKEGGDLASIHNAFEDKLIRNLNTSAKMLIGLRYYQQESKFKWSDNSVLDYTDYANDFESNMEYFGYCAVVVGATGKWESADCEIGPLPYVCRRRPFDYSGIPIAPYDECPERSVLYTGGGTILSPGFPDGYKPGLNCVYRLAAEEHSFIKLTLTSIHIDEKKDGFLIYDGHGVDPAFSVLSFGSVEEEKFEIILRTSKASFVFYSSSFAGNSSRRWRINWQEVAAKPLERTASNACPTANNVCPSADAKYLDGGELLSPGYPGNYTNLPTECLYKLMVRKEYIISLKTEESDLPGFSGFEIYHYSPMSQWVQTGVRNLLQHGQGVEVLVPYNIILLRFYSVMSGKWRIHWTPVERNSTIGW